MDNIIVHEFRISKELSFTPEKEQVIYIESEYNSVINNLLQSNLDDISSCIKQKSKEFIYIPNVIKNIKDNSLYYNPFKGDKVLKTDIATSDISNQILSYSIDDVYIKSGLIRCKEVTEDYYIFSYYAFEENFDKIGLLESINSYTSLLAPNVYYSSSPYYPYIENPDDNADYDFDTESKKLIEEIKERVELLKQKGVNELVLKSILSKDSVKLSRLVITNEYKIFLTDYNNLEITMYPLPKAVFFLFLNYPNGILFKDLPDYRDELIAIYKSISGRESIKGMEKSIDDIVNPTLNSINEKCSRIREAFVRHFDESIAKNYYITGARATPKKIALDRQLVVLEDTSIKFDIIKTPFEYIKHEHPNNKHSTGGLLFEDDLPY